jgi:hypothetical protein
MGTGIPVPETIPEGSRAFVICVPDSPFFYSVVMGALKITTFKYYWNGTDDQKTAVTDRMLSMYYHYQEQDGCMICTLVEDCIANDEEVRNALGEWFLAASSSNLDVMLALQQAFNSAVPGNTVPSSVAAQNLFQHNDTCDENTAWGNIRNGIIDRAMQRVQDVLEQIELTTDNQEMLASFLDIIPVLGVSLKAVGVGSLISFFDNVRAFLKDAFEAGDTVDKRDQMACDLFCLWQVNCSLSFAQVRQYFWDAAELEFPSWENAFNDIVTLVEALGDPTTLTGDIVVNALLGAEYGFVSFINDWGGVHLNAIQGDALIGDPSDDWMTLCDCSDTPWCRVFTGDDLQTYFPAYNDGTDDHATWTGTGWAHNSALPSRIALVADMLATVHITRIEVGGTFACPGGDTNTMSLYTNTFATFIASLALTPPANFTGLSLDEQNFEVDAVGDFFALGDPITGEIDAVAVHGTGTPPTIGTPC